MTLGAVIAAAVPLTALGVVTWFGRVNRVLMLSIAGGLAAGIMSTYLLRAPEEWWLAQRGRLSLIVVGAPVLEELGKAAIIPILVATRQLRWYVDGVLVGLAAGTGFAIRENLVYLSDASDSAVELAIARVTSTNLMHAGCTAIIGAALATPVLRRRGRVLVVVPFSLALAMGLHSAFNRLTFQSTAAVTTTLVGVAVFFAAAVLVWVGEPLSRRWARADMVRQGLARGEASVLGSRREVADILEEMTHRFGRDASAATRELIETHRKIGIATQPGSSVDESAVQSLRVDANDARRRVGAFAMLWLRSQIPSQEGIGGLWNVVQSAAAAADNESAGQHPPGGLWNSLSEN